MMTGVTALPAGAAETARHRSTPETIATGIPSPLHQDFGPDGKLYVADAFTGRILRVNVSTGESETVAAVEGAFTPGLDVAHDGTIYFTASTEPDEENEMGTTALMKVKPGGEPERVADLLRHEVENNPDGQPQVPGADTISNPYAVLALHHRVIVADAGANSILSVSRNGKVRTLTALPVIRQGVCRTAENNGVENGGCDPVPTSLALGPDGHLYVSGLGAEVHGRIWKIDLKTGEILNTYAGYPPLTGIAVGPLGNMYALSLFGNRIIRVSQRNDRQRVELAVGSGPVGGVIHQGRLYYGTLSFTEGEPGTIQSLPLGVFFPHKEPAASREG